MTNKEMVAVTGIGVLSPIGVTVAEVAESLKTLRSGIRLIEAPPLQRAYPAGVVDVETEPFFSRLDAVYLDRCQQLAALAGRAALADAGLDRLDAPGARAGLYYGNVNGDSLKGTQAAAARVFPELLALLVFAIDALRELRTKN